MNPDVTKNITSQMSELQLQFLSHLNIQPLQTHFAAPAFEQHVDAVAPQVTESNTAPEPQLPAWQTADISLPLVQDMLVCLQQYGVAPQWFYQAQAEETVLSETGLYSAPPQFFFTAEQKKQLWRSLSVQLVAEVPADTDQLT